MRKKLLVWMTVAVLLILLLPLSASAKECEHQYQISNNCTEKVCTLCGYTLRFVSPQHEYEVLECGSSKCVRCDHVIFKASSHLRKCITYTCKTCWVDVEQSTYPGHIYTSTFSGCLRTRVCDNCGKSYTSREHVYEVASRDGCVYTYNCKHCSESYTETKHKSVTHRTPCGSTEVCFVCDLVLYQSPYQHVYAQDRPCEAYPTCIRCGEISDQRTEHNFYPDSSAPLGGILRCRRCDQTKFSFTHINWSLVFSFVFLAAIVALLIVLVIQFIRKPQLKRILRWAVFMLIWIPLLLLAAFPDLGREIAALPTPDLGILQWHSNCSQTMCDKLNLVIPIGNGVSHSFTSEKVGCTRYRTCTYCGKVETSTAHELDYSYNKNNCTSFVQCNTCSYSHASTWHSYSADGICKNCGKTKCELNGGEHRFRAAGIFSATCQICGYSDALVLPNSRIILIVCIVVVSLIIALVLLCVYPIEKQQRLAADPGFLAGALLDNHLGLHTDCWQISQNNCLICTYYRITKD